MIKKIFCKLFGKKEELSSSEVLQQENTQVSSLNSIYADELGIKPLDAKISPTLILLDILI